MDPLILKYADDHKTAYQAGLKGLFRYSSYSKPHKEKRHAPLLRDGLLYHSLPEAFNDPFDCKYNLRWPNPLFDSDELRGFVGDVEYWRGESPKEHTIKSLYEIASKILTEETKKRVSQKVREEYSKARICCFTSTNDNPLFWAHYADSHKGYCVRFDVTEDSYSVISTARRVMYTNEYPNLTFPIFQHIVKFISPFYRKSEDWEYEGEFRSFFNSEWLHQPENNGESLLLKNDNISDVYFGLKMPQEHKDDLIELISKGPFTPRLWETRLHPTKYELEFVTL